MIEHPLIRISWIVELNFVDHYSIAVDFVANEFDLDLLLAHCLSRLVDWHNYILLLIDLILLIFLIFVCTTEILFSPLLNLLVSVSTS